MRKQQLIFEDVARTLQALVESNGGENDVSWRNVRRFFKDRTKSYQSDYAATTKSGGVGPAHHYTKIFGRKDAEEYCKLCDDWIACNREAAAQKERDKKTKKEESRKGEDEAKDTLDAAKNRAVSGRSSKRSDIAMVMAETAKCDAESHAYTVDSIKSIVHSLSDSGGFLDRWTRAKSDAEIEIQRLKCEAESQREQAQLEREKQQAALQLERDQQQQAAQERMLQMMMRGMNSMMDNMRRMTETVVGKKRAAEEAEDEQTAKRARRAEDEV